MLFNPIYSKFQLVVNIKTETFGVRSALSIYGFYIHIFD